MTCRSLIICGNAREITQEELEGHEIWALRTGVIWGADRYWDFHGMEFPEPTYRFKDIPIDRLHSIGLPLSNSICILVAYAVYTRDYDEIIIKGSPLRATEYKNRRTDLAFIVGWARGKGVRVHWEEAGIDFINIYQGGKDGE